MCYNISVGLCLTVRQQFASVAQLDRASDSDSEGRRFDSCQAHHVFKPFEAVRRLFIMPSNTSLCAVCAPLKKYYPVILAFFGVSHLQYIPPIACRLP